MAKKKNSFKIRHLAWIALLAGVLYGAYQANIYFNKYKKNVRENSVLYIYPGSTFSDVLDSLEGKLEKLESFEKVAEREGVANHITPGRYELTPLTTNITLARAIKFGYQSPMMVTISGYIRTPEILAKRLGSRLCADSSEFVAAFRDRNLLDSLSVDYQNLISLVIPNSYQMYWTTTPKEVSILASIVYCESKYEPEYGNIASVYLNRLKKGWRLCADPTVIFATGDFTINRVLRRHLATPSPYNTYLNEGLPPGPIAIPTKAAIDGVLNPAATEYMYFCANPKFNGTHRFAKNGAEHERNARDYRKALDSLIRARRMAQTK